MSSLLEWVINNEALVAAGALLSVVTFAGTLIIVPVLLTRMPADYFVGDAPPVGPWVGGHPLLRSMVVAVKNLLGIVLVLMGLAMLVLPGQGLLTILIGLALIDFPGKRRLEQRIASVGRVRRSINWLRRRAGRPPIVLDSSDRDASHPDEAEDGHESDGHRG